MPLLDAISSEQWRTFKSDGVVSLGVIVQPQELETLRERIDAIMLRGDDPARGIDCSAMLMMLEGGPQTGGWKGSTLNYRKIQGLERDLHYRNYLTSS